MLAPVRMRPRFPISMPFPVIDADFIGIPVAVTLITAIGAGSQEVKCDFPYFPELGGR